MVDKRDGHISGLNQILDNYLASHSLLHKSRQMLAALVWAEVVGPWYRQHTAVTRVNAGILTVQCDAAPRAQQLQLDSSMILAKLNKRLGGDFIKEIRATSGRLGRGRQQPSVPADNGDELPPELSPEPLAPAEEQVIQGLASEIDDPELRERFVRVMRNFCRLERWKQAHGYKPCPQCGRLIKEGEKCMVCYPGRQPQQGEPEASPPRHLDNRYGGNRRQWPRNMRER